MFVPGLFHGADANAGPADQAADAIDSD